MTSEEIKKVLDLHKKWCNNGQNGKKADLCWADLREADLCRANLCWANLREANLCRADLRGADLRGADLRGANLREANLREANLREANLREADLCWANLREANLREANLCWANLRGADLRGADLDYSCFPLWCGGSKFACDTKLVYQLLAHICTLEFEDTQGIKGLIMPFAVKSHRAGDLGLKEESK